MNDTTETIAYIADSLVKHPVTYLNATTAILSVSTIETWIKIAFYAVSIFASILVSYKYWLEIKRLKK